MFELIEALKLSVNLIFSLDQNLLEIVFLSLRVTLTALAFSCVLGFLIGSLIASNQFYGRRLCIVIINALMSFPPVVVGLVVYLYFSNSGPLGWLNLLYTPAAMIIAQTIIITPIIIALSRQILEDLNKEYLELFSSFCMTKFEVIKALVWDARYSLLTVILAGFGRGISEVGAVIIVGGNINHYTRVMTTSIALETSMGNLPHALALGSILLLTALIVNALVIALNLTAKRYAFA